MKRIFGSVTELIGNTPMIELKKYTKQMGLGAGIFAKLEYLNPAGSVKDRIALSMIEDAESRGILDTDSIIIEPTSGNTGIGLASVAAAKGYKVILTMPETMSMERRNLLKAYGAKLVLTDGASGMRGAIAKAEELTKEIKGSFMPAQFENRANPAVHFKITGPEIWKDMSGKVDVFVSGIGTGGTISGAGEYLRSMNPDIKIIAVEPLASPVLSGGQPGSHKIQGIGAGFVPKTLNTGIYDEIIKVSNEDALSAGAGFPRIEGILIGISSAAALHAATMIAKRPGMKGSRIVVIFPDNGERYLSTSMYGD